MQSTGIQTGTNALKESRSIMTFLTFLSIIIRFKAKNLSIMAENTRFTFFENNSSNLSKVAGTKFLGGDRLSFFIGIRTLNNCKNTYKDY